MSGVHHPNYRITRATQPGFWTATCKECPPGKKPYSKTKGYPGHAESAVIEHLRDAHNIIEARGGRA
jgi:hypothetical protein